MKKTFVKPMIPMLCAGLLCTPVYATGVPETESIHISDTERTAYQHMIEESVDTQETPTQESGIDGVQEGTQETEETTGEQLSESMIQSEKSIEETVEVTESVENTIAAESEEEATENTQEDNTIASGEDMISVIETESGVDADGFVTMDVSVAENVLLPVTVTMKGKDGTFSFTVSYQDQPVKLKPGTYSLTKVVDGNNQELDNGANLTIPEENGEVYLDFTKPEEENESLIGTFVTTNLIFIPIAAALWFAYKWWMKHN